jgi:hypothetical protein
LTFQYAYGIIKEWLGYLKQIVIIIRCCLPQQRNTTAKVLGGAIPSAVKNKNEKETIKMRTPMITRTFKVTIAGVLCLNIESAEPFVKEVELPRTYKNDEAILKKAHEVIDTATVKAVSVSYSRVDEIRYGMSETDFIANSQKLPLLGNTDENNIDD